MRRGIAVIQIGRRPRGLCSRPSHTAAQEAKVSRFLSTITVLVLRLGGHRSDVRPDPSAPPRHRATTDKHRATILLVASWSAQGACTGRPPDDQVCSRKAWKQLKGGRVWRPRASARTSALLATYDALHSLTDEPGLRPESPDSPARYLHTSPSHVTLAAFRMRLTPRRAPREAPAPAHGARAPRGSRPPDEGGNQWRHHRSS